MSAMIEASDISHHYGIRPILRNVSLTVARGEVVALMGPNGSGKSTLLSILGGLFWPLKGRVIIDGKVRRGSEEEEMAIRQQVVYLPADPWVPQILTGREWILSVGRLYSVEDDHLLDHTERLLDLFDLRKQADTPIRDYSTGQKKKAALCATIASEAKVMLLDEPFAGGLDPSGILALKRVLQHRARGDEYIIVMATPVPELVAEIADRVGIIKDGRLVACDTIPELSRLTGATVLDEIFARMVNPAADENLRKYFGNAEGM
jgi:ABC-2 type transport system ATP-binding protein